MNKISLKNLLELRELEDYKKSLKFLVVHEYSLDLADDISKTKIEHKKFYP